MIRVASVAALFTALGWTGAAYAGVRLTKGPYVTGVFTTGADVRFELDQASPATVTVARDADPGSALRTFESRDLQGIHAVNVTGLEVATRYAYSVRSGGVGLGEGHFSTAPHDGSNAAVTFLVYGDDRTDTTAHGAIVRAMLQVPSAFLVNTGDMVADGGDADAWQTFFDVEAPLLRDRPLFVAIGNHELVNDSAGVNFARYFGFPDVGGQTKLYGTLRFGFVRLFFLNAMHGLDSGEEREWLARELASSDTEAGVVWRIAVTHHGPWSSGPHGPNGKLLDAHIPELLAAHQIDLILSGHDHIYERGSSGNLKYLVSGGGGRPALPDRAGRGHVSQGGVDLPLRRNHADAVEGERGRSASRRDGARPLRLRQRPALGLRPTTPDILGTRRRHAAATRVAKCALQLRVGKPRSQSSGPFRHGSLRRVRGPTPAQDALGPSHGARAVGALTMGEDAQGFCARPRGATLEGCRSRARA